MVHALVKNWWAVALVGVLAVILGIYSLSAPGMTLAAMVGAFGAFSLFSGLVQLVAGFRRDSAAHDDAPSRTWLIVAGAVGIIAGLVTFFYPAMTLVTLYTVIAVWAIVSGIAQVAAAIVHRHELPHTWLVALGGVVSVVLGGYLLARPVVGMIALAYAIGIYAIVHGITLIAASIPLKRLRDTVVTIGRVRTGVETPSDRLTPR
jgi:uncharacterized membrane protein HdeD (DUF308 family)